MVEMLEAVVETNTGSLAYLISYAYSTCKDPLQSNAEGTNLGFGHCTMLLPKQIDWQVSLGNITEQLLTAARMDAFPLEPTKLLRVSIINIQRLDSLNPPAPRQFIYRLTAGYPGQVNNGIFAVDEYYLSLEVIFEDYPYVNWLEKQMVEGQSEIQGSSEDTAGDLVVWYLISKRYLHK